MTQCCSVRCLETECFKHQGLSVDDARTHILAKQEATSHRAHNSAAGTVLSTTSTGKLRHNNGVAAAHAHTPQSKHFAYHRARHSTKRLSEFPSPVIPCTALHCLPQHKESMVVGQHAPPYICACAAHLLLVCRAKRSTK